MVSSRSTSTSAPADVGTLAELLRQPHERALREALLLLLTFTAGCTDAIAYVELGQVFASFMSGNFLFLGLSAVQGESARLLRTAVALGSFTAGAFLCELYLGKGPAHRGRTIWLRTLITCFALDAVILAVFGMAGVLTGDLAVHPAVQVALLALVTFSMGPVGIVVGSLGVPGVVANALTGTLLQLSKRFAQNVARREPTHPLRTHVLLALCCSYVLAAVVITLSRGWPGRVFIPTATLAAVVLLLLGAIRASPTRYGTAGFGNGHEHHPLHHRASRRRTASDRRPRPRVLHGPVRGRGRRGHGAERTRLLRRQPGGMQGAHCGVVRQEERHPAGARGGGGRARRRRRAQGSLQTPRLHHLPRPAHGRPAQSPRSRRGALPDHEADDHE